MAAPSSAEMVSLPSRWPRHVRSAIVHAVSMAGVAFTATQARAENHFNARSRLRASNDRLLRQVALLREELRIKDAWTVCPHSAGRITRQSNGSQSWSCAPREAGRRPRPRDGFWSPPSPSPRGRSALMTKAPAPSSGCPSRSIASPSSSATWFAACERCAPGWDRVGSLASSPARGFISAQPRCAGCSSRFPNRNDHWPDKRHADPSPRNARTTSGTSISRRFPRWVASGSPGGRSRSRSGGRSVGGWPSSSITSRDAPWEPRTSRKSRRLGRLRTSWTASAEASAVGRTT